MRLHWADIFALITLSSLEIHAYDNEHHENFIPRRGAIYSREVDPTLKPQIDAAVAATANVPHYFWTGLLPPFRPRIDSVEVRARDAAARLGGTTLEDTVANIAMPPFSVQDQNAVDTWTYASELYANASQGVAYVYRGEQVRPGNVFDSAEFPLLQINPAVTGVYQILAHLDHEEQPTLIWPTQNPATVETLLEYQVATSCAAFSRSGLWQHQRTGTTTNFGTWTRSGWYYGGQASTTSTGAFTYSLVPEVTTDRPTQSAMAFWVDDNPSFDVQFATTTAFTPTSVNYGNGWIPYVTACPYGSDIGKMGGLKIRALPAGDSITFGFQSSTGDGYRLDLEEMIVTPPWAGGTVTSRQDETAIVEYIGSVDSGTMPNPENEGHSGAEINTISGFVLPDLSQNPNVVFLLAGTNDINNGDDIADAPTRLMALVDAITSALPTAAVLVGTLPLNGNADIEAEVETFNYNITQSLLRRAADGVRTYPVPMENIGPSDMADGLHPNDEGYQIMANSWFSALWQVAEWGWIEPATGDLSDGGGKEFCATNPVWYPQGEIANGAGLGPNGGTFNCLLDPEEEVCGCEFTEPNVLAGVLNIPPSGNCSDLNDNSTAVRFADLNGDGRAEYLWLDTAGVTTAFLNLGSSETGIDAGEVQWLPSGVIATGVGAHRYQVQFADLNGDGRAEYLWVHDDGSVEAWLNLGGPDDGPNAAKVSWFPAGTIATGIGEDGTGVRFADLNGDGRAEYLWLDEDGAMTAYLNLGSTTGGEGAANVQDNVILADINGDGRADYLTVTHDGGVAELWINGGGPNDGPNAAQVVWFPQGVIATGVGTSGLGVQFADLNGDGRAEYLDVNYLTSAVNAWLNGCQ
ncbi:Acetyl xylan esterase [Mycena sanguinolenta]|uniref:Acetyl xylan esterase n=1 Tax=Mycena sanguinolenta TaxID=230812 RepID=A0A8H6ZG72_9AGAR|nr:Acetyl xylan esterase [Mycena sanguinolenta]